MYRYNKKYIKKIKIEYVLKKKNKKIKKEMKMDTAISLTEWITNHHA